MYSMKIFMGAKIFCLLDSFEETVKHTSVHMSQQRPISRLLVFLILVFSLCFDSLYVCI